MHVPVLFHHAMPLLFTVNMHTWALANWWPICNNLLFFSHRINFIKINILKFNFTGTIFEKVKPTSKREKIILTNINNSSIQNVDPLHVFLLFVEHFRKPSVLSLSVGTSYSCGSKWIKNFYNLISKSVKNVWYNLFYKKR